MALPGVSTSFEPRALSITRRSRDIESGMVRIRSYPFAAATMARPMPVFPEVGSTKVVFPGEMSPLPNIIRKEQQAFPIEFERIHYLFSASTIMLRAIRSFTELQGSMLSSFTIISA